MADGVLPVLRLPLSEITSRHDVAFPTVWIESDPAIVGLSGYGRVMVRAVDGPLSGTANDNGIWMAGNDGLPAIGRDAALAGLSNGDSVVIWIDLDHHVQARLLPSNSLGAAGGEAGGGYGAALGPFDDGGLAGALRALADASPVHTGQTGDGTRYRAYLKEINPGQLAVMWIALGLAGQLELDGRLLSEPVDGDSRWVATPLPALAVDDDVAGEIEFHPTAADDAIAVSVPRASGVVETVVVKVAVAATTTGPAHASVDDPAIAPARATGDVHDAAQPPAEDALTGPTGSPGRVVLGTPDSVIITGTTGDDVLIADPSMLLDLGGPIMPEMLLARPTTPVPPSSVTMFGDIGSDVFVGGRGDDRIEGDAAGPDALAKDTDPEAVDRAVYAGDARNYSVTANGDGTYTVVDARFDTRTGVAPANAAGARTLDGVDVLDDIELVQFLNGDRAWLADIANNGIGAATVRSGHTVVDIADLYQVPTQYARTTGNVATGTEGYETVTTPVGWDDASATVAQNGFDVAAYAAPDAAGSPERAVTTQAAAVGDGFAIAWSGPSSSDPAATTITINVFDERGDAASAPVVVTESASASDRMTVAGTARGAAVVWVEQPLGTAPGQSEDVRFTVVGGDGQAGDTIVAATGAGDYADVTVSAGAARPTTDGAPPSSGVAVAWVEAPDANGYGEIGWQWFEAAPLPATTEPVTTGPVPAVVEPATTTTTDADTASATATIAHEPAEPAATDSSAPIVGRAPATVVTDGGQIAVVWVEPAAEVSADPASFETIRGIVVEPTSRDSQFRIDLTDLFEATGSGVAEGYRPTLLSTAGGDIVIGWVAKTASGYQYQMAVFPHVDGGGWTSPETLLVLKDFGSQAPGEATFSLIGSGEPNVILSFQMRGSESLDAERYDLGGNLIGDTLNVTGRAPASNASAETHDVAGLADGRFVVVYTEMDKDKDKTDVTAQVFDTRAGLSSSSDQGSIGNDNREIGTVFDDVIDTGAGNDTIDGALGNDVLIGGIGNDVLRGGGGNDDLLGGTGSDQLSGDGGDDLLMGGYGRDVISGGDGIDTVSYRGENRAVTVDLEAGVVRSDAAFNGVTLFEGPIADLPADAASDAGVEDLLGTIVDEPGGARFDANHGIENIEGGLASDTLLGDAGDNVISGRGGDDVIDGRGGFDTALFRGLSSEYTIEQVADGTGEIRVTDQVAGRDGATTLYGIEALQFSDALIETSLAAPGLELRSTQASGGDLLAAAQMTDSLTFEPAFSALEPDVLLLSDLDQYGLSGAQGQADAIELANALNPFLIENNLVVYEADNVVVLQDWVNPANDYNL